MDIPRIRQRNFVDRQTNDDGISVDIAIEMCPRVVSVNGNGLKGNLFAIRINDSNRNSQY